MSIWDNEPWKFGKIKKVQTDKGIEYVVNSFTRKGATYVVQQTPMGQLYCNCPAYQYQHQETCKHVERVMKFIKVEKEVQNA